MGTNDGRVVSELVVQATREEPIATDEDGSQTRSFCNVDEMFDGMIRLMKGSGDLPRPVPIGNRSQFSITGLAEVVLRLVGSSSAVVFCPSRRMIQGKQDRMQTLVSLEGGLKEAIAYFGGSLNYEYR